MSPTLIIARLTFREATRRKIVLAALVLGFGFLVVFSIGFSMIYREISLQKPNALNNVARNEGFNVIVLSGLYAVTFLSIAMGALLAADTLAGEISSGTVQTLVTKPMRRAEIVLGKWLGFAGMLALYVLLMAGGVFLSVWLRARFTVPNPLKGIGLIYLESLVVMTVSLACSSRLSALATGGVVFGLYGLAFIGGWVEQIGSFFRNQTAVDVGIVSSLFIPSEALWRRAAFEMQSPLSGAIGMSPFAAISVPSALMVVYAAVYILAALRLAVWFFQRRDL